MLDQFFRGLLRQLQGDVDLINEIVPHNATKGTLNEDSLRRLLRAFLPARYGLSSGVVVDSFGNRSKQVDIIIHDAMHYPRLFNAFSQTIFPVETVFGCIEVKTRLGKSDLREIASENQSIAALRHCNATIQRMRRSTSTPNAIDIQDVDTRAPLTFAVGYRTESASPATVKGWFGADALIEFFPDITLFLDLAMAAIRPVSFEKRGFDFLIVPLRESDLGGTGHGVLYAQEPGVVRRTANGSDYRSSAWKGHAGYPVMAPEKALLSFAVQLARAIEAFPKAESFDPTPYLSAYSLEGIVV